MSSILSEPGSNVIRQRVEDLFDMHLQKENTAEVGVITIIAHPSLYGYFKIFITPSPSFGISWLTNTFGDFSKGECVDYKQVTKDVLANGWQQHFYDHQFLSPLGGHNDAYTKDEKHLSISFSGQCAYGLDFSVRNP